ncbi:MAG: hypothetical protein U1E45_15095 [Geminicoccaceae bacterium]
MSLPAAGIFTPLRAPNTVVCEALNALLEAVRALPGASRTASHTIAGGTITPTAGTFRVDTEGGVDSDDLDRLTPTNMPDGAVVELSVVDGNRAVRLRHAQGGNGQILLATGSTLLVSSRTQWVRLVLDGTNWRELGRTYGNQLQDFRDHLGLGDLATMNFANLLPVSSDDFEVTSGGEGEFEHGFDGLPAAWWATLRCIEADAGWDIGDTVMADGTFFSSSPRMVTLFANSTVVGWKASNAGNPIAVVNYGSGTVQTVTLSKWRLKLWASAF